jgi:hypothetical protein
MGSFLFLAIMTAQIEKDIIKLLGDGEYHSWANICKEVKSESPVITTTLVHLISLGKITQLVTEKNIFYKLSDNAGNIDINS